MGKSGPKYPKRYTEDRGARVLVSQGAEARVYTTQLKGFGPCIVKERFAKKYRHPILDQKLTKKRVRQEARALGNCKELGVRAPAVIQEDQSMIYMEYLAGAVSLKQVLFDLRPIVLAGEGAADGSPEHAAAVVALGRMRSLAQSFGGQVAGLHKRHVVHGDLTTSNAMLCQADKSDDVTLIDFGLSYPTQKREDKAVDLYVLERALESTHPEAKELFKSVLKGYGGAFASSGSVVQNLQEVRSRGRKRSMLG